MPVLELLYPPARVALGDVPAFTVGDLERVQIRVELPDDTSSIESIEALLYDAAGVKIKPSKVADSMFRLSARLEVTGNRYAAAKDDAPRTAIAVLELLGPVATLGAGGPYRLEHLRVTGYTYGGSL